jgi:hypothetical protein
MEKAQIPIQENANELNQFRSDSRRNLFRSIDFFGHNGPLDGYSTFGNKFYAASEQRSVKCWRMPRILSHEQIREYQQGGLMNWIMSLHGWRSVTALPIMAACVWYAVLIAAALSRITACRLLQRILFSWKLPVK